MSSSLKELLPKVNSLKATHPPDKRAILKGVANGALSIGLLLALTLSITALAIGCHDLGLCQPTFIGNFPQSLIYGCSNPIPNEVWP